MPPGLVQAAQAFADGALPLPEAAGQQGSRVRVGLRELAESSPGGSRPGLFVPGLGDHHVAPGSQPLGGAKVRLPLFPAITSAWWLMTACRSSSLSGK